MMRLVMSRPILLGPHQWYRMHFHIVCTTEEVKEQGREGEEGAFWRLIKCLKGTLNVTTCETTCRI